MTSNLIVEIAAATGGGLLLLAGLTFGTFKRVRYRRSLIRLLNDPDPEVRGSSVMAAEKDGFSWYIDALAGRVLVEDNPDVKVILAESFIRHPWEPGSDPRQELLDRWARRILAEQESNANGSVVDIKDPIENEFSAQRTDPKKYLREFSSSGEIGISKDASQVTEKPVSQAAGNGSENSTNPSELDESPVGNASEPAPHGGVDTSVGGSIMDESWFESARQPQYFTAQSADVFNAPYWSDQAAVSDFFGESRFVLPDEFVDAGRSSEFNSYQLSHSGGSVHRGRKIVLVTGAARPVGVVMIHALKSLGYRVIAADSDPLGMGLRLAHDAAVLPTADDRRFLPELLRLADRTKAEILIPTVVQEFIVLGAAKEYLRDIFGLKVWLPSAGALDPSWDRWSFIQKALDAGICVPPTELGSWNDVDGPWVVKSRYALGVDEVRSVDTLDELKYAVTNAPEVVVQHRLSGTEFTADVLAQPNGELLGAVLQFRLVTRSPGSLGLETFSDDELTKQVKDLLGVFKLDGPASVHGFIGQDGKVSFLGVKPTYSSGLSLCIAAGADMIGEYLRIIEGLPVRQDRLQYQPGVRMLRGFVDTFER
ncbi:MAG: hypothetical protein HKL84_07015 [Acidimicrobiaceae bacterium]|nr:hypothetical protein [Acidimicrobiaceae bacterium]